MSSEPSPAEVRAQPSARAQAEQPEPVPSWELAAKPPCYRPKPRSASVCATPSRSPSASRLANTKPLPPVATRLQKRSGESHSRKQRSTTSPTHRPDKSRDQRERLYHRFLLLPQHNHRIHPRRAPRRNPSRN